MEFKVEQRLIINGDEIVNKGDIVKITLISQEVIQGEFREANDDFEEISILRNGIEWAFEFSDIEEVEIITK